MLTALVPEDQFEKTKEGTSVIIENANERRNFFWKSLGPGLIAGVSDDDPSGIVTYSMAGASFGFGTLWTAVFILPLLTSVQFTCAKIGMVTGLGLGTILRKFYPKAVLYPAVIGLVIANSINAGADISAIANAIHLLIPVPVSILTLAVVVSIISVQLLGSYRLIVQIFKLLTITLFAYFATVLFIKVDPVLILRCTFFPEIHLNREFLSMLLAILGTTLSPYLFFWQTDQEVDEKISNGKISEAQRRGCTNSELKTRFFDVKVGMSVAVAGMYFIILLTGATLHGNGHSEILTANDAACALYPLAGPFAVDLFALGIIGTGFLAVPVLTSSCASALAQVFDWKHGLHQPVRKARKFYAIIALSTTSGLFVSYLGVDSIKALYWAAVLNGLLAAPLLVLIMCISNNRVVMGAQTNKFVANILGWSATAIMFAAVIGMVWTFKP